MRHTRFIRSLIAATLLSVALCACAQTPTSCDFADTPDAKPVLVSVMQGSQPASLPAISSRVDVVVTSDDGAVVVFLSSLRSVEWRLAVLPGATVAGVFLTGPAESEVYGVPGDAKLIRYRKGEENAACQQAGLRAPSLAPSTNDRQALLAARQLMSRVMPRPDAVETVRTEANRLTLSQRPWPAAADSLADAVGPAHDPSFVRAGDWGLMQLAMRGDIEFVRAEDLATAWRDGARRRLDSGAAADTAPADKLAVARKALDTLNPPGPWWIVKRPIQIPAGLHSMSLIVPVGVESPSGDAGRAMVLLMDDFRCAGSSCPEALRVPATPGGPRLGPPAAGYRDPTPRDYRALDGRAGDAEMFGLRELLRRGAGS